MDNEEKDKPVELEERLQDVEDAQMLTRLEIIKIRNSLKKGGLDKKELESKDISIQSKRLDDLENMIKNLNEKISGLEAVKSLSKKDLEKLTKVSKREDFSSIKSELEELKNNFESFKNDTEEGIKIIVDSVKKVIK